MKVAILTQPLLYNYGGILQNYALQAVLKELGHEPFTLDCRPFLHRSVIQKNIPRLLSGKPLFGHRLPVFQQFVSENLSTVPAGRCYKARQLEGMDAVIVGSDQVWRSRYNYGTLEAMFLGFAPSFSGPIVAYAASFGLDRWDADERKQARCRALAQRFKAVSVREASGIQICREALGVEAALVPDPVILLQAADYVALCKDVPPVGEAYTAAYILDDNPASQEALAGARFPVRRCTSGVEATLTVPQWIALFRDAQEVITDSFHGAVLAALLEKPCTLVQNAARGAERFRLFEAPIDFAAARRTGIDFLKKAL